jgi:hypothetical protein
LVGDWDFGGDLAHASSGWVLLVSASVPNENVKDKKKKKGRSFASCLLANFAGTQQGKFTVGFLSPAAELRRSTCTLMEPWERAVHTLLSCVHLCRKCCPVSGFRTPSILEYKILKGSKFISEYKYSKSFGQVLMKII